MAILQSTNVQVMRTKISQAKEAKVFSVQRPRDISYLRKADLPSSDFDEADEWYGGFATPHGATHHELRSGV